jgi:hypothetical protein
MTALISFLKLKLQSLLTAGTNPGCNKNLDDDRIPQITNADCVYQIISLSLAIVRMHVRSGDLTCNKIFLLCWSRATSPIHSSIDRLYNR